MFYQEPCFQLSGADNLGNDQVIAPIVAELRDFRGGIVRVDQDRLMHFKQPGEHRWIFLAVVRARRILMSSATPRVADRNASERLHAFAILSISSFCSSACLSSSR
jgi:hypothetical protein